MSVVEVVGDSSDEPSLFLTCEHAGNELPPDLHGELTEHEREWLLDHWGWDIGAERFVRSMIELQEAVAVLSRFSRLLCDVNRSLEQDDLIRTQVLGDPVEFNQELSSEEIDARVERYHEPYHDAVDAHLARATTANPDLFLVSVHTFTPVLAGEVRDMEIGLLFDDGQPYVHDIYDAVRAQDFDVALNEPYSGKEGLIYSVERHGTNHDVRFLEIEIRNDLVDTPSGARDVAQRISSALERLPWYDED